MTSVTTGPRASIPVTVQPSCTAGSGFIPPPSTAMAAVGNGLSSKPKSTVPGPSPLRPATGAVQTTKVSFALPLVRGPRSQTGGETALIGLDPETLRNVYAGIAFGDDYRGTSRQAPITDRDAERKALRGNSHLWLESNYRKVDIPHLRLNYHPHLTLEDFPLVKEYGAYSDTTSKTFPKLSAKVRRAWQRETEQMKNHGLTTWEAVLTRNAIFSELPTYGAARKSGCEEEWARAYLEEEKSHVVLSKQEKETLGDPSQWPQADPMTKDEARYERALEKMSLATITASEYPWSQIAKDMGYSEEKTEAPGKWREKKTILRSRDPKTQREKTSRRYCINGLWFKKFYPALYAHPTALGAQEAASKLSRPDSFKFIKRWVGQYTHFAKNKIQLIFPTEEEAKEFNEQSRESEEILSLLTSIKSTRGCAGNCEKPWCGIMQHGKEIFHLQ
jgi:hypothetical protein